MNDELPSPQHFLEWANKNPEEFQEFYYSYIEEWVGLAEEQDYFGTEGFDKRFA